MKNFIKKICVFGLLIPAFFLCACGEVSDLDSINLSRYYESDVTATVYGNTTRSLTLSTLTASSPNSLYMDSFVQYSLTGIGAWAYKMYIDYVTLYVYASEDAASEMIITLTITNVADEDNISESYDFSIDSSSQIKAQTATLYTFKVEKTIATATETTLTIDILQSAEEILTDTNGSTNSFRWMAFGLTIYGESRAYSN